MKILKIESGRGFYKPPSVSDWNDIDKIDKDGLLRLLNAFLDHDVEMDAPDDTALSNQAQAIIYKSIFEKLKTLADNKSKFKDESDRLYLAEIQKYSQS